MNMKYTTLLVIILLSLTVSLSAQNNKLFFNAGYEIDLSISNTFNEFYSYHKNQFTNAGTFSIGFKTKNTYFFLGAVIKKKILDFPCITFEEPDSTVIQLAPARKIVLLEDNSSLCTHSYYKEANFIEIPIGIGYVFPSERKLKYYIEGIYAPIMQTKGRKTLTTLSTNTSHIQTGSNFFQSWTNISIRGGIQRPITEKLTFKLGVALKSNNFDFDRLLVGGDIRLEYYFFK